MFEFCDFNQINKEPENLECKYSIYFLFFSLIRVGHFDLKTNQIVENIMSTIDQLITALPGGAFNLRNIYIKTQDSMALPLYVSMGMFLFSWYYTLLRYQILYGT